ncbi:hypothetical protein BGX34_005634, partial [Mortierella sp. NVP85]
MSILISDTKDFSLQSIFELFAGQNPGAQKEVLGSQLVFFSRSVIITRVNIEECMQI